MEDEWQVWHYNKQSRFMLGHESENEQVYSDLTWRLFLKSHQRSVTAFVKWCGNHWEVSIKEEYQLGEATQLGFTLEFKVHTRARNERAFTIAEAIARSVQHWPTGSAGHTTAEQDHLIKTHRFAEADAKKAAEGCEKGDIHPVLMGLETCKRCGWGPGLPPGTRQLPEVPDPPGTPKIPATHPELVWVIEMSDEHELWHHCSGQHTGGWKCIDCDRVLEDPIARDNHKPPPKGIDCQGRKYQDGHRVVYSVEELEPGELIDLWDPDTGIWHPVLPQHGGGYHCDSCQHFFGGDALQGNGGVPGLRCRQIEAKLKGEEE
jgi:hypothetical protein